MAVLRESPWYQQILQEGEEIGEQRGRQEEKQAVAIKLLNREMSVELVAQITELSIEEAFATPVPEPKLNRACLHSAIAPLMTDE